MYSNTRVCYGLHTHTQHTGTQQTVNYACVASEVIFGAHTIAHTERAHHGPSSCARETCRTRARMCVCVGALNICEMCSTCYALCMWVCARWKLHNKTILLGFPFARCVRPTPSHFVHIFFLSTNSPSQLAIWSSFQIHCEQKLRCIWQRAYR